MILVTGASGFIGAWVVHYALATGARVRATVRDPGNDGKTAFLRALPGAADRLEFAALDLTGDAAAFEKAVEGCAFVIHVASPVSPQEHTTEDDFVKPAVSGTVSMLKACCSAAGANVKRVVVTSSVAAIGSGGDRPFTDKDWKDISEPNTSNYSKSKTLAERAAWDFVKENKPKWGLVTINPSLVVGPALTKEAAWSTSNSAVLRIFGSKIPAIPQLYFGVVDVRDVAIAHVSALEAEGAVGHRFIVAGQPALGMPEMAQIIAARYGAYGYKIPTFVAPNFLVWFASFFDPALAMMYPNIGLITRYDVTPSQDVLGLKYRPREDTIRDACECMLYYGLVERKGDVPVAWRPPGAE